jgi:alpha-galactosidase
VSQASFSDAHECASIPIIASNLHRLIRPEQSQIWAVLRANDDVHKINYRLTSGFLGRLCLSGEIFDLNDENWQAVLDAIAFYEKIKDIIKYGKTTIIDCKTKSYNNPVGYQAVIRECDDKALLVIHIFKDGANPPVENYLKGWNILETFGSNLDDDFQGKAFLLSK